MNVKVSVIIPCYNAEQYLDLSIGSVYEQNYANVELIVVNDGSTDGSEAKIIKWQDKFLKKGFVLKYFYQENQGQAAATNLALKHVTGEYITLLDADDCFLQGSLKKRAYFLDTHNDYVGVRSNGLYVQNGNRRLFITAEEEKQNTDLFSALTQGKTNNWAGTYMVRTDLLFEIYPDKNIFVSPYGQNFQILLPVAYKGKFGFIDEPLMEYNIYEESHSHIKNTDKRYAVEVQNAKGWREIYINVLEHVITDNEKRQNFINTYNAVYYRNGMNRAIWNGIAYDVNENYQMLLHTGLAGIEDKICYYTFFDQKIKTLYFRMIRKYGALKRLKK